MDLESAIGKHAEWKVKFRSAISKHQQVDIALVGNIHACEFGTWLDGDGKKQHKHLPEFTNLVEIHRLFHEEAVKVATLINAEKYSVAEAALNVVTNGATNGATNVATYSEASKQMAAGVMKLRKVAPAR